MLGARYNYVSERRVFEICAEYLIGESVSNDTDRDEARYKLSLAQLLGFPGDLYTVWSQFLEDLREPRRRNLVHIARKWIKGVDKDMIPPCRYAVIRLAFESLFSCPNSIRYRCIMSELPLLVVPKANPAWAGSIAAWLRGQQTAAVPSSITHAAAAAPQSTADVSSVAPNGLLLLGLAAQRSDSSDEQSQASPDTSSPGTSEPLVDPPRKKRRDPFSKGSMSSVQQPSSKVARIISPFDLDRAQARQRAQQRQASILRPSPPTRAKAQAAWAAETLNSIRSVPLLNYFDLLEAVKPTVFLWKCRCCGGEYEAHRGRTGNLITHLHHCSKRLDPLGLDLEPWGKHVTQHSRSERKAWKRPSRAAKSKLRTFNGLLVK
ncbi:hypothetical protein V8E36_002283 [Tilletia maclaganii]